MLPHGRSDPGGEQKRKTTREQERSTRKEKSHVRYQQLGQLLVGAILLFLAVPQRPNHAVKPGGSFAPHVAYLEVTQREIWNR